MHVAAEIIRWVLVGAAAMAALSAVSNVGKERKPTDPGDAAATVLIDAIFIVLLIVFWGR